MAAAVRPVDVSVRLHLVLLGGLTVGVGDRCGVPRRIVVAIRMFDCGRTRVTLVDRREMVSILARHYCVRVLLGRRRHAGVSGRDLRVRRVCLDSAVAAVEARAVGAVIDDGFIAGGPRRPNLTPGSERFLDLWQGRRSTATGTTISSVLRP